MSYGGGVEASPESPGSCQARGAASAGPRRLSTSTRFPCATSHSSCGLWAINGTPVRLQAFPTLSATTTAGENADSRTEQALPRQPSSAFVAAQHHEQNMSAAPTEKSAPEDVDGKRPRPQALRCRNDSVMDNTDMRKLHFNTTKDRRVVVVLAGIHAGSVPSGCLDPEFLSTF